MKIRTRQQLENCENHWKSYVKLLPTIIEEAGFWNVFVTLKEEQDEIALKVYRNEYFSENYKNQKLIAQVLDEVSALVDMRSNHKEDRQGYIDDLVNNIRNIEVM